MYYTYLEFMTCCEKYF